MKKKERRICAVDSLYSLFLYFLICGVNEEDIFLFCPRIPRHVREKLNHILFPNIDYSDYENLSRINKIKKRIITISKRIHAIIKARLLLFIKTRNYHVKAYGQGHLNFSFPIYEYEDTYLLEDGLTNYALEIKEPIYDNSLSVRILHFFGTYVTDNTNSCLGSHENIKKVYLTKNEVPEIIKNKTTVIDINQLWNMKTKSEKNKILEIYGIKDIVNSLNNNLTLLITQCLSEDDFIPLDEEINIYRYLIEKQNTTNIIIKTHPREKKEYATFFPEITIINKPFPLELLKCIGLKIDKIITVSSNAALNFIDECEIELYDKKTSSKKLNDHIKKLKEIIYKHE